MLSELIRYVSQDIQKPPTEDVERFLAMIQFDPKGKLESLQNFECKPNPFFEELGLSPIPNFSPPRGVTKENWMLLVRVHYLVCSYSIFL